MKDDLWIEFNAIVNTITRAMRRLLKKEQKTLDTTNESGYNSATKNFEAPDPIKQGQEKNI